MPSLSSPRPPRRSGRPSRSARSGLVSVVGLAVGATTVAVSFAPTTASAYPFDDAASASSGYAASAPEAGAAAPSPAAVSAPDAAPDATAADTAADPAAEAAADATSDAAADAAADSDPDAGTVSSEEQASLAGADGSGSGLSTDETLDDAPAVTRAGATVNVSSETQLQSAVKNAAPGDVIRLAPGTYSGTIEIKRSGTAANPITLTAAGGGVNLTASLRMPSCNASSPDPNRTIRFSAGASYWNITGLSIRGGIMMMGGNAGNVRQWLNQNDQNWQARRAVPGRGSYDPSGILASTAYLQGRVGVQLKPSIGVKITNNDISLKGIQSAMNKNGVISGNQIHDIACGVGPGIWLGTFSDGFQITGNNVHDIAQSSWKHYMQEGIRVGGSSDYNVISNNTVSNLPGDGRAFTTDEDGSWNTFSNNKATNVAIGYNDQMAGWGNQWTSNTVTGFRTAAFSYRMMDARLKTPSMNSSTYRSVVSCNTASGGKVVFQAGAMIQSQVRNNTWTGEVQLGSNLRGYWTAQGNTWNGSSKAPGTQVSERSSGC